MWTNLVEFAADVRRQGDAVGFVVGGVAIVGILVAAILRWISYMYRLRAEEEDSAGRWESRR